jgi:hypothetical protein
VTITRSKREKEKKTLRKVKGRKSLDEEIEDDISARKMNRGQINKRKNPSLDALDHSATRKERQVGEAMKMWVKLT